MKIQKTVLVVYSGIKGSFEEKILESVLKGIKKRNDKAVVIDLYKDKFSPYFEGASLARYSRGETADKHVPKYIKAVKEANEIIIVHETIAQAPDPMMKGFIDKTFLSGHF
ncbi:MAG: NAD(P)H-dependent oxidoreductase [Chlamydiia bacterium]|nr:NAD(P)H-dependent oxidoreductase [Chlamydiia bacterium]